jgi:quercetin dioxygenase-like cupin family protein
MRLNPGRVASAHSWREDEHFTGEGWVDLVSDVDDAAAYTVFFSPRARTHWHRHTAGQLLLITAGSGWVVSRVSGPVRVRAGDTVWTEPGEEHWHGADEQSVMIHTAVSLGAAEWLEPVGDDEYAASRRADH